MQNVKQRLTETQQEQEEISYSFLGGSSGFVLYWLVLAVAFIVYGSNMMFLLLYTWPFFLALLPFSVLLGIIFSTLLRGHLIFTVLLTGMTVLGLFWLVFSFMSGWS
ncbi:DUF3561 family protein [Serratia microhaemolytica]|uniref:DUF3561 family protein n=1 Tax=Serratia microhaemolytica TaxID=2675110 RepID=UPI000FDF10E4|nr:DUF3561 family protein [Serratia microhaemolytica]